MKTVLFIYFDKVLEQTKCDAYLVSDTSRCIEWRMSIYSKEAKRGEITLPYIQILDSIHFATMTQM